MKTKHTPGPWQMNPNNHQEILADGRTPANTVVAIVPAGQPDAHLIAAAPEMLEALEQASHYIDACFELRNPNDDERELLKKITAALAKARDK